MNQNTLKEERLQLLEQVNVLTESNCKGCNQLARNNASRYCRESKCQIIDKFRSVGIALEVNMAKLRALRDEKHVQMREKELDKVKVVKPKAKAKTKNKAKRKGVRNVAKIELTLDMYNDFKAQGKTDKEVMDVTGMNNVTLNQFKREHDLIGKHKRGPVPKQTKFEEATVLREKNVSAPIANVEQLPKPKKEAMEADCLNGIANELADFKVKLNEAWKLIDTLQAENIALNARLLDNSLPALYAKQAELENFIADKHGISIQDYLDEQQLAILVELAESANEWQGFKYWKQNKDVVREKLLEETVDVLHLLLARGIAKGWKITKLSAFKASTITTQYMYLLRAVAPIEETQETYETAFITYVGLTEMLGFKWSEVEQAYAKKHQENIDRQNNDY